MNHSTIGFTCVSVIINIQAFTNSNELHFWLQIFETLVRNKVAWGC
jgi:hypothetical protein